MEIDIYLSTFESPRTILPERLRGLLSFFSWSRAGHELPNSEHMSRHSLAGSTHPAPSFPLQVRQIDPREQYERRGSVLATLTSQKGAGDPKMTDSPSLCFPLHMWLATRDYEESDMLPIAPPLCRRLSPSGVDSRSWVETAGSMQEPTVAEPNSPRESRPSCLF